jgi:hypothetical protein
MLRVENPSRFLLHEHFSWILTVYRVRPAIVWQFQGSSLRFVILSTFHIIFSITLTNFGSRLATQSVNAMALTLLEYNQCTYKLTVSVASRWPLLLIVEKLSRFPL